VVQYTYMYIYQGFLLLHLIIIIYLLHIVDLGANLAGDAGPGAGGAEAGESSTSGVSTFNSQDHSDGEANRQFIRKLNSMEQENKR
jgi:hypothetical protein